MTPPTLSPPETLPVKALLLISPMPLSQACQMPPSPPKMPPTQDAPLTVPSQEQFSMTAHTAFGAVS